MFLKTSDQSEQGKHWSRASHWDFYQNFYSSSICKDTSVMQVSNEAKIFNILKIIGLVRYFPAKIQQSLQDLENNQKVLIFSWFFEVFGDLGEKQRTKLQKLALLKFSASFDTLNIPLALQIVKILQFSCLFSKFYVTSATQEFHFMFQNEAL